MQQYYIVSTIQPKWETVHSTLTMVDVVDFYDEFNQRGFYLYQAVWRGPLPDLSSWQTHLYFKCEPCTAPRAEQYVEHLRERLYYKRVESNPSHAAGEYLD